MHPWATVQCHVFSTLSDVALSLVHPTHPIPGVECWRNPDPASAKNTKGCAAGVPCTRPARKDATANSGIRLLPPPTIF